MPVSLAAPSGQGLHHSGLHPVVEIWYLFFDLRLPYRRQLAGSGVTGLRRSVVQPPWGFASAFRSVRTQAKAKCSRGIQKVAFSLLPLIGDYM
jgi:hypothetical protein